MAIELPALPFALDALEPYVSRRTLDIHHGKHHQGYVTKLNSLIEGTPYAKLPLEDIIRRSANESGSQGIFNNAAQTWNHSFFWQSMTPRGGRAPTGDIAKQIDAAFGRYDKFRELFLNAATGQFGSGWVWLVKGRAKLEIVATANAQTPLTDGKTPLLNCDVWEHAYYLDYQNRRGDFVQAFLDHLLNWSHVAARLNSA